MTDKELNQNLENLEDIQNKKQTAYEWFANADPRVADIELDIPPRCKANRPIPFVDYGLEDE
ncbi:hypothetical protein QJU89_08855 [Pasteurella skyensis]|uniref:Uncharacterized protein n=1 Tax=Phocoenobacter skyensis TaxID=97481 RepID=A0AAJ6NA98_9PAST|nr:hypothetical protein [Pasteurella skyensis]MDP8163129.1 hypothetical protein [Pasteurella skyensis]MDP8173050.1 hypothetical protein [Pasteurella skyensis]MDP8177148.1 hypothetical protein [Pasteurella skyensis]MDP8179612.1 hypothetical protein [Pasteurella skyensis]MDP8183801.1 hypothetical protein [Pasteurella skyensis]